MQTITLQFLITQAAYHTFSDDLIGAEFYSAAITALEDDVRISKRLHIPSRSDKRF